MISRYFKLLDTQTAKEYQMAISSETRSLGAYRVKILSKDPGPLKSDVGILGIGPVILVLSS